MSLDDTLLISKKVIFFDGDGTLWYPRSTLRTRKPHWVYLDASIANPIAEMIPTPTARETLIELGDRGIWRVLVSASPLKPKEGLAHRKAVAEHVGVLDLLDEVHVTPEVEGAKGNTIATWLEEKNFTTDAALMVGDVYEWDILPALKVGVEGLLIASDYERVASQRHATQTIIEDVADVLRYL